MPAQHRTSANTNTPTAQGRRNARTSQVAAADGRARPPADTADQHTVEALHVDLGGRWLVTTQRSQHIWDLDAMTYQRLPGLDGRQFDHDGDVHTITNVGTYPAVGLASVVFFDDPLRPWIEQWRISSPIVRITRLRRG